MSRRWDTIGGVLGAAIFIGVCVFIVVQGRSRDRDTEQGAREPDAPGEVVDEQMRFRLRAPDKSWRLLGRADAAREDAETHAMMLDAQTLLAVRIERVGELPLARAVAQAATWTATPAADQRTLRWVDREVGELTYRDGGDLRRERVFVRDGWLHRITVSRVAELGQPSEDEYREIFAAFSLLDGTPRAPIDGPVRHDPRGVDWRVVGNRWESASAGLAVEPPTGWRIVAGHALHQFRRDVDMLLVNAALGCYVSITAASSATETAPDAAVMMVELAGEPRPFVDIAPDDPLFAYRATSIDRAGGVVHVSGWCPRADGEPSLVELRRALAAITPIPDAERTALATALAAEPFAPGELGADCAYRAATFVHYGAGLGWRTPSNPLWRVAPCDRAADRFDEAILAVELPGVTLAVVPDATVLDGGIERWAGENLPTRVRPIDLSAANPALGAGLEAVWTEGKVEVYLHRVVPLVGSGRFRVHVYGTGERLWALRGEVDAALAALAVREVSTPVERGNTFVDLRAGYAVDLPGWSRTDHVVEPTIVDRSWRAADAIVGVIVEAGRRDHVMSRTRVRRRASSIHILPRAVEAAVEVDGAPAVRMSWREYGAHVAVFLVERHDALYTIWTRGDAGTAERTRQAFRFVDQPDQPD